MHFQTAGSLPSVRRRMNSPIYDWLLSSFPHLLRDECHASHRWPSFTRLVLARNDLTKTFAANTLLKYNSCFLPKLWRWMTGVVGRTCVCLQIDEELLSTLVRLLYKHLFLLQWHSLLPYHAETEHGPYLQLAAVGLATKYCSWEMERAISRTTYTAQKVAPAANLLRSTLCEHSITQVSVLLNHQHSFVEIPSTETEGIWTVAWIIVSRWSAQFQVISTCSFSQTHTDTHFLWIWGSCNVGLDTGQDRVAFPIPDPPERGPAPGFFVSNSSTTPNIEITLRNNTQVQNILASRDPLI